MSEDRGVGFIRDRFLFSSWMMWRLLWSRGLGPMGVMSLVGVSVGVAFLVVSLSVISGFESTLKKHTIDVTSHLQIIKLGGGALQNSSSENSEALFRKVKAFFPEALAAMAFVRMEALAVHSGKAHGVLLQGLEVEKLPEVLNLCSKLIEGSCDLREGTNEVLIGKGLREELGLKVGDSWKVVVPLSSGEGSGEGGRGPQFRRRMIEFQVRGILDLGKYEYDERMVLMSLTQLQKEADLGGRYLGLLVKAQSDQAAVQVSRDLSRGLGAQFRVWDWREVNGTLFQAVDTEKPILFVVIALILVAASVNVSTALNISVMQKYPQIAMLKAMGMSSRRVRNIFLGHGFFLGSVGTLVGMILGWLFGKVFYFLVHHFALLSASVYKIGEIELEFRSWDLIAIFFTVLVVCFLAVRRASLRGARLSTVEGLRYE